MLRTGWHTTEELIGLIKLDIVLLFIAAPPLLMEVFGLALYSFDYGDRVESFMKIL
jgi:hypothetical protein